MSDDPLNDFPCTQCDRPIGEHTVAEYREHHATAASFAAQRAEGTAEPGEIFDQLTLAAGTIDIGSGALPVVQFHFSSSQGAHIDPITLVMSTRPQAEEMGVTAKRIFKMAARRAR